MTELVVAAQPQERAGPQGHRLGGQAFHLPREGNSARSNFESFSYRRAILQTRPFPLSRETKLRAKGGGKVRR